MAQSQDAINQLVNHPVSGGVQPCVMSLKTNSKVVSYLPIVSDGMVCLINSSGYLTYRKETRFNEIGKEHYLNLGYVFLGKIDYNGYKVLTGNKINRTSTRRYPSGNTSAFAYTVDSTCHANAILVSVSGLVNGDILGVGQGDYSTFSDNRKITEDGTYLIKDEALYNAPWGFKLWNTDTSIKTTVAVTLEAIFRDF